MISYNLIGSAQTNDAADGQIPTFNVVHPGTGKIAHQVQRSTAEDLSKAVETAHNALPAWRAKPVQERAAIVHAAIKLLQDESSGWPGKLRDANRAETSVTDWWSAEQVHVAPLFLGALAELAPKVLVSESIKEGHSTIHVEREPYGVCLAIAAWNAVHLLTSRAIVTPLLAGNTVVLKTSEQTPHTQALWAELLYAAGLPRECLSVVHVSPEDAPHIVGDLVADRRVRHVNFTGSTRVGSILAGLAGKHLKPTLMELGGKAPVILLPDADIEIAASHIIFGTFMNAGQICMSTERVLVAQSRYDDLVKALQKTWTTVKDKQPRALFTHSAAKHVRALTKDALAKGAEVILTDGFEDSPNEQTPHFHPTLLGPAKTDMRIYREESFGPVAVLIPISDSDKSEDQLIDEMVELANDTDYGLTAAVWGKDLQRAQRVARRIDAGAVHINAPTNADLPNVPHGGWKSSGWGRFNGAEGLKSFTQIRTIEVGNEDAGAMPLNIFEL